MVKKVFHEEKIEHPTDFFKAWQPVVLPSHLRSQFDRVKYQQEFDIFNFDTDKFIAKIIFFKKQWATYFNTTMCSNDSDSFKFNYYQAAIINLCMPVNGYYGAGTSEFERRLKNAKILFSHSPKNELCCAFQKYILFNDKKILLADVFCNFLIPDNTKDIAQEKHIVSIFNLLLDSNIDLFQAGLAHHLYPLLRNNYIDVLTLVAEKFGEELLDDNLTVKQYFSYLASSDFGTGDKIKSFLQKFLIEDTIPKIDHSSKPTFKL